MGFIRNLFKKIFQADLQKISQEVLSNLRQEIHEAISRVQVELGNTWEKRLKDFEGRIQKLEDSVNKLSQTTLVQSQSYADLKLAFDNQSRDNSALKEQISNLEKQNSEWERQLKDLQNQLDQLKSKYIASAPKLQVAPQNIPYQEPGVCQPEVEGHIIDINGTDAWRNHVDRLKDVSLLSDYISKSKILLNRESMAPFAKSVTTILAKIPVYVDKKFKEPTDIDEYTSEEVARQTREFVKEYIWDLLHSCHGGMKHSQGAEKKFYETFCECLEGYLSSVGVYRKNITVGMDVRTNANAKWFEKPYIRESSIANRIGIIDEIEVDPYFIPYRDDDGGRDELTIKGVCIAFGDTKRK